MKFFVAPFLSLQWFCRRDCGGGSHVYPPRLFTLSPFQNARAFSERRRL